MSLIMVMFIISVFHVGIFNIMVKNYRNFFIEIVVLLSSKLGKSEWVGKFKIILWIFSLFSVLDFLILKISEPKFQKKKFWCTLPCLFVYIPWYFQLLKINTVHSYKTLRKRQYDQTRINAFLRQKYRKTFFGAILWYIVKK